MLLLLLLLLLLLWRNRYELHVLLVEHGKVCPQCFKRSNKAGAKRKGKGGTAAPVVCPLAPLKRGGKEAAAAAVAVKASSSCGDSTVGGTAAAAGGGGGGALAAAAGVWVKQEANSPGFDSANAAAAVAVKVEQLQDFACGTAAAAVGVKREAEEQAADEQQVQASVQGVAAAMEDAVKQPSRSRKRTRRA
jgi:hypothetical protein